MSSYDMASSIWQTLSGGGRRPPPVYAVVAVGGAGEIQLLGCLDLGGLFS
jgi:hypothetical protein